MSTNALGVTEILHYSEADQDLRRFWMECLADLHRRYRQEAKPILDALVEIDGRTPRSIFYTPPAEGLRPTFHDPLT